MAGDFECECDVCHFFSRSSSAAGQEAFCAKKMEAEKEALRRPPSRELAVHHTACSEREHCGARQGMDTNQAREAKNEGG